MASLYGLKPWMKIGLTGAFRENFFSRLVLTAQHMINTDENQNEKGERM